jgi:DNA-binding response OmpR family regulator
MTMRAILEMNGFKVDTAASSIQAGFRLGAERYDLVITDLKMEHERAGFDVVRFARELKNQPPVLILTACPELGGDWKEQRAAGLFTKPANVPQLLESIQALLAQEQITRSEDPARTVGESAGTPGTVV